jgi:hypothetical protein
MELARWRKRRQVRGWWWYAFMLAKYPSLRRTNKLLELAQREANILDLTVDFDRTEIFVNKIDGGAILLDKFTN